MRSRLQVLSVLVAGVVGCGDDSSVQMDADIGSDASPDAPVMGAFDVSTSNGSPGTAPSFGVARTGVTSQMTLTLTNATNGPSGAIAIALTGAAELTLDLVASTCDGANLAPDETCSIVIAFQPTTDGGFQSTLSVTSDLGVFALPITAMSGSSDVMLTATSATLGRIEIGVPSASFTLMNIGAFDAAIGTIDVTGTGLAYDSTTCSATLAPTASCTISFRTTQLGDVSGTASAIVDGETLSTSFSAKGAYRLTITTVGSGSGTVKTYIGNGDPNYQTTPLVDCGTVCSVLSSSITGFELIPDAGSVAPVRPPANWGLLGTWLEPAPTGPKTINLAFRAQSANVRFFGTPIDLGLRAYGGFFTTSVELQNIGAGSASLGALEIFGGDNDQFTVTSNTCGSTLAAGANCFIGLTVRPTSSNTFSTPIRISTVENGLDYVAAASMSGQVGRHVTVSTNGAGTGKVTSTPAGIDCPYACNALLPAMDAVTLNAVPDSGMTFESWTGCPSPSGATCTIPAGTTNRSITATFGVSGTSQVQIVQVGTGLGQIEVTNGSTSTVCNGSCSVTVTPGTNVRLETTTMSQFGGYTGACTNAATTCSFNAAPGTSVVNVGIAKYAKEAWIALPPGTSIVAAAFDASENLVIATPTELRKISSSGLSLWSKPIITGAVATGPGDVIAVMTSTSVMLLDSTGNALWTKPGPGDCYPRRCLAVNSDGAVAVRSSSTLMRFDASGVLVFSTTIPNASTQGVGFSAGNVIVPMGGADDHMYAYPYDLAGTQLASFGPIGETWKGVMSSTPTTIQTSSYGEHDDDRGERYEPHHRAPQRCHWLDGRCAVRPSRPWLR
jgi:hypothetical protein